MTTEGAGCMTWGGGARSGPGEKEEKVDGDPDTSKASEDLETSVRWEANDFNIHRLQTPSPSLSIDGVPQ